MKKFRKKLMAMLLGATLIIGSCCAGIVDTKEFIGVDVVVSASAEEQKTTNGTVNNIKNGITESLDAVEDILKFIVNNGVVSLGLISSLVFLLINIISLIKKNKAQQGEDIRNNIAGIVICVIVMVLVLTFSSWGWKMIGM
ncbi:MAG: hypothetical protein RSF81_08560 [Oscillospiraceae bacterium]